MLRRAKGLFRHVIMRVSGFLIRGRNFRRFARQSPPALPGRPIRVAFVNLIPSLGDTVMMFPLLDALHRDQPDAVIEYFGAGSGAILATHPAIAAYHAHQKTRRFAESLGIASDVLALWQQWRRQWAGLRFHLCVVPRGGVDPSQSGHLAWLLGGSRRFGYSRSLEPERQEHDTGENDLFTDLVQTRGGAHEITRAAEVLTLAGLLKQPVHLTGVSPTLQQIAASAPAKAYVQSHPELAAPYAVVAPGASVERRRWKEQSFAELAEREMVRRGWTVVLIGSPGERAMCERIANSLSKPAVVLTGTTFPELAAVCRGARLFVGNDSGTGHVAGALGIPTLEVTAFASSGATYHHASPNRSHPSGPFVRVVQPLRQMLPCVDECVSEEMHCIGQVTVEEMQHALQLLLQESGTV